LTTYYIPTLSEYLGPFCNTRIDSSWKMPTHVVTLSSMYWSRLTAMYESHNGSEPQQTGRPSSDTPTLGLQYDTTESMLLTKPTLIPHWQLYLVLTIQPLLTICAFIITVVLYRVPLHRGFGPISILAGLQPDSLALLRGASLSGQLDQPLTLKIEVLNNGFVTPRQILYSIASTNDGIKTRLSKGLRYS
jgi:hypothetical protein